MIIQYILFTALIMAGITGASQFSTNGYSVDLEDILQDIILRSVHEGEPGKAEQIRRLSITMNVPMDDIESMLLQYVKDGYSAQAPTINCSALCIFSIQILANLQTERAIPLLAYVAFCKESAVRNVATRAIIKINHMDTLVFAEQAVTGDLFSDYDKAVLYDELKNLLGSVEKSQEQDLSSIIQCQLFRSKENNDRGRSISEYLKRERKDRKDEKLRDLVHKWQAAEGQEEENARRSIWQHIHQEAILQFLVDAIQAEENRQNVFILDRAISKIDREYQRSFTRERILGKYKDTNVRRHAEYFNKELLELKNVPNSKRTELRPLKEIRRKKTQ